VPVEVVWYSPEGAAEPAYWLVTDQATWTWLWRRIEPTTHGREAPPSVDFSRSVLIVVHAGYGSSYAPLLEFAGYRTVSDATEVFIDRRMFPDCVLADDIKRDVLVGRLPRRDLPARAIVRTTVECPTW
jgi:hypothetical protein